MSFWDLYQHMQISDLESKAKAERRRARRKSMQSNQRIDDLEEEVAKLQLLCRALVRSAMEAGHLTTSRLGFLIKEIDAEDGVVDGKVTRTEASPEKDRGPAPTRRKRHT